ncbi:MAG: hypothetical protein VXZ53_01865, partial [Planctomycetota bacterium]|nr:hypothetical protein [Planctomycetota bacterium]
KIGGIEAILFMGFNFLKYITVFDEIGELGRDATFGNLKRPGDLRKGMNFAAGGRSVEQNSIEQGETQ